MDVEVEFSLYVMGAEFAKTIDKPQSIHGQVRRAQHSNLLGFVPGDNIRQAYLIHPCEESQESEY